MVNPRTCLAIVATTLPIAYSQSCTGQSCILGDLSGSSGQPYNADSEPVFPVQGMECCIIHYNPPVAQRLYDQVPGLEGSCSGASILMPMPAPAPICQPKVLIFAAGTAQPTDGGGPLGMDLQSDLNMLAPGQWIVQGVPFPNTQEGNVCVGLPGGVTGKQMIAKYVNQCPGSALFVGGYSQGAFVAHESVGNSSYASRINAVVTFGDPMNGSPIKGYSGPIRTTCHDGDGVCGGFPDVGPQHLNYDMNTAEVAAFLNGIEVSSDSATTSIPPVVGVTPMMQSSAVQSSIVQRTSMQSSTMPSFTTASSAVQSSTMQSSLMQSSMMQSPMMLSSTMDSSIATSSTSAMSAMSTLAVTETTIVPAMSALSAMSTMPISMVTETTVVPAAIGTVGTMATDAAMTTGAAATTTLAAFNSASQLGLPVAMLLIGPALLLLLSPYI